MESQTFGEKIRALRISNKYSLKEVGIEINYSPRLLSEIERNKKVAPERIIEDLATLYETSYKELMVKYLSEKLYYAARSVEWGREALEIAQKRLTKENRGTVEEKNREKIIDIIKSHFAKYPIEKAWLFGSMARDTPISKDSDIDILISFKKPNKISLFDLSAIKYDLSVETGREIDLVEKGRELNSIKSNIEKEKILIYAA